jgi:predicted anti-sigma-YlaC factor YlaD
MSKDKVNCKDVMQHICESLGEELNSEKCIEIKKHLEECTDCKNYFESVEITIDCYRKYNVKMPEDVHERLMKFLNLDDCE